MCHQIDLNPMRDQVIPLLGPGATNQTVQSSHAAVLSEIVTVALNLLPMILVRSSLVIKDSSSNEGFNLW
jgi:hypothetical protein